ncbi:MAG: septum formation protein Maf [Cyanobacteria bacterium NC_groundwater_1444_Ag_S-0.65um_54_12]|nr:septum formation protein Maf [Cyanobacteria bacterium NC_groundwater_1444_Ag_S-0.65um_54_12]
MLQLRRLDHAQTILASASPRRAALLRQLGIPFLVDDAVVVDERFMVSESPGPAVERLARQKAQAGAERHPAADIVIAGDTVVVIDQQVLGKPENPKAAELMLFRLAGREHEVVTGFAVMSGGNIVSGVETTLVGIRQLEPTEITAYVATGEPLDKAGAYAAQGRGALLVAGISGDYHNVVGLPLFRLGLALRQLGWTVL